MAKPWVNLPSDRMAYFIRKNYRFKKNKKTHLCEIRRYSAAALEGRGPLNWSVENAVF
jgi:hypothetical protein